MNREDVQGGSLRKPGGPLQALEAQAPSTQHATGNQDTTPRESMPQGITPHGPSSPGAIPRGRMPVSQRAKIFVPFDPLRGFQAALREQERLAEERFSEQDFTRSKEQDF